MRISVIASDTSHSQQKKIELETLIKNNGLVLDSQFPDYVMTIGGDGTLLSAFHRYVHRLEKIQFIGIHTGHLGFYTDWRDFELEELVASLLTKKEQSVSYPLLEIKINYHDKRQPKHFLALNESVIRRISGTMRAEVTIEDTHFESFRGDGLSVATPTGSTAYNKSVGGAVLHPSVNALQLSEIASINNRVYRTLGSPLVIANNEWITISLNDPEEHMLSVDHLVMAEENINTIEYRVAKERIHFGSHRHTSFWSRVKDAFIQ